MEAYLKNKIQDWQYASETVCDLYLKKIELEQTNIDNPDYLRIKELLPFMVEREKKLFMEMHLTEEEYKELEAEFKLSDEKVNELFSRETIDFYAYRLEKQLKSLVLNEYNDFIDSNANDIFSIAKRAASESRKYNERYLNALTTNFVAMIEKYNSELDDKIINDYLIYLKYLLIATTPVFEKAYLNFHQNTLPTTNVLNIERREDFPQEVLEMIVRKNVHNAVLDNLNTLVIVNDIQFYYMRDAIYRILAQSKAYLIGFKDELFITEIEVEVSKKKKNEPIYTEINKLIVEMFSDAKELIKKDYYVPKRNG